MANFNKFKILGKEITKLKRRIYMGELKLNGDKTPRKSEFRILSRLFSTILLPIMQKYLA